ncbi:extracellular solute-binding protein [Mycobacterium sp. 3519A]|uniref:extracellular solute-binding protein n=1 Tax=Mycobacterium sp. 3519A TaxID=2057184 RepID=UPI000C7A0822|nr:extracellular solute-binding protein [Mycobacterium sp. 3519A]
MGLRHRPARGMAVVAIGLAATLIAACGAPPHSGSDDRQAAPTTSKPWDGLTGTQREDALVAAAKAEGELTVYSAFNDEQAMADAFTKKYGIKVNVYNANSETVLQRVVQEATAHKLTNDVLVAPATDMTAVESKGLLGDYRSPYRDAMPDAGKSTGWTGVRRLAFVAGYNTGKLTATDLPADYAGFADPKWNGRISMEYSDIDWYATVRRYYQQRGMSDDDISTMFRKIAANSKTAKGHTVQAELLAAGQFDVALSVYTQSVNRLVDKGAQVAFGEGTGHIVSPVVVRYDAGGVMGGTDNPAGAALYLDFQLGPDGAAVDQQLRALPPLPTAHDPLAGAQVIDLDVADLVANRAKIADEYNQLVTGS